MRTSVLGNFRETGGFPRAKRDISLCELYQFVSSLQFKLCSKVLHFVHLHLYNANFTKHIVKAIGYPNTTPQNNQKNTYAEGKHAALAIIHACVMYGKCYIGDGCTLLDCIIVMQHPSQKGV